jgi:hypothetical protein
MKVFPKSTMMLAEYGCNSAQIITKAFSSKAKFAKWYMMREAIGVGY